MDSAYFSQKRIVLLTLYLLISKSSNTAQESENTNSNMYHWIENALSNQSFEYKTSQFKDDLDKFTKRFQSYDQYPLNYQVKENLFEKLSNLQHHLSLQLTNHNTLVEVEARIKDLEKHFNYLKENSTDGIDETHKFHDIITLLNNFKTHIYKQLETLKIENEIASFKPLIEDCVKKITVYHFDLAEKKIKEINYDQKFKLVVKEVYKLGEENFYTLLNFADTFKNDPKNALILYEALHDEMNMAGHESLSKLLLIIRRLRSKILEHHDLRTDIELFLGILKNSTKTAAINEVANAFILNYLPKIEPHIYELAETGFFDMNIIIEAVMDRISRKLATKHLSSVIRSNKGLCINETTPTPLTFRLKRILSWSKYCTLSQDIKKLAQRAMNSSPVSIGLGTIEYCEKVCIMNVNYNEYLYDPDHSECIDKYSNISCPAYTTDEQSIGKSNQFAWNLKPIGNNKIQIISYNHNYTLFVDDEKWDDERRSVSTRQISENGDKYEWQFESDGDFVFIKNIHYQEYLTASVKGYINNVTTIDLRSMVTTSKRLRNVFTFVNKKLTPDCYWTIVECP